MYERFFGLKDRPFKLPPDPQYLYLSSHHKMALLHLEYGLTHQAGFVVITGEIGTGKTLLVKTLLDRMGRGKKVATLFTTTVGPQELLALILQEFEIDCEASDHSGRIECLQDFLIECYARRERAVLIVDEAQNLSLECLEEVRLLSNLQTESDYLINIILVGQPELKTKLAHPNLRQLAQRISVHYHLNPLTPEETKEYVRFRLKVSGGDQAENIFSEAALDAVARHAKGIPRLINLLCDACMVNAFADEKHVIEENDVEETVEGEGAGAFWQIANQEAENSVPLEHAQRADASSDVTDLVARIEELEKQVRELGTGLISVNRLLNEWLAEMKLYKKESSRADAKLLEMLERERMKVKKLMVYKARLESRLGSRPSADKAPKKEAILSVSKPQGSQRPKSKLWPW